MKVMAGHGPFAWSTSREIMRRSAVVCYDVNGYYAALGIPYPYTDASISTIRRAYLARGGPEDSFLTQVFTTFLNAREKAIYDAQPLGSRYLDPETLHQEKVQAVAQGNLHPDTPQTFLDTSEQECEDHSVPAEDLDYPYSVLLWDVNTYDGYVLAQWQNLLLNQTRRHTDSPRRIALGVSRGKGQWTIGQSLGIDVVVVDRYAPPNSMMAAAIVEHLVGNL